MVLKSFLETDIREISIFSCDEKKQDDMRHKTGLPKCDLIPVKSDVQKVLCKIKHEKVKSPACIQRIWTVLWATQLWWAISVREMGSVRSRRMES